MSGFHRCVTCGTKLPANDPHEDCVSCLGPEHAASALADKAFCTSCASFQTRTLRRRARRAVGDRSPSSGSSHTLSAPQPSLASPPVKLPLSRSSSSQVTAGQRSPDARRKRDRSHSPPVVRGPSPRGERPQISRSRSGSPRWRGRSRSPRRDRRGGVTELTNKMSQFMDLMMGQQSLLMSLATARAADEPVGPVANQPMVLPQPLPIPVAQQDAWDVDAISRDASEGEPLHGEDSVEAELTSHHSESEMEVGVDDSLWSLVERATRHLGLEWPATEEPRRSLFESPLAQGQQSRMLPAFPDFVKEVQSTWGTPASAPATSRKAAAFTMQGASEAGLASFPPVGAAFAALVKSPTLSGLVKDPTCPNKQGRITEVHLKKGYSAATEAVRLSNLASLLSVYQAALLKDLPDYPLVSLRAELGLISQLLVKLAQLKMLPAFPDFVKEVQSTWGTPASSPATLRKAAAFTMQGASEAGLASFPPVGAAFAALVKSPTLSGLVKDPTCPNKQCRITEVHLKKGYSAATEAVRLSNLASLLSVYQAALIKDLPDYPSVSLRAELGLIAQLLVKLAQLNARAQGRSIASLVVARRQLWLSQARVQEHDKAPLLDAPITPGHTFGPAVEEMLQRSAKAKEASQQLATIWPRRPFQVKRPQEHQWRRTPPQHQPRPGGTKTFPASTAARGQIPFGRPQRTGWRPRGGGRPRPRGAGQAPRSAHSYHPCADSGAAKTNTRCPPKRVQSADRFFSLSRPAIQPPKSYSVGGPRSSGQLTGKPTGARPDHRGRWCAVSRGPKPCENISTLQQIL
ncbi:UNVERIFIED_CONTAM: hypothetical protein FKN15_009507 [Acipenser sinensis]